MEAALGIFASREDVRVVRIVEQVTSGRGCLSRALIHLDRLILDHMYCQLDRECQKLRRLEQARSWTTCQVFVHKSCRHGNTAR